MEGKKKFGYLVIKKNNQYNNFNSFLGSYYNNKMNEVSCCEKWELKKNNK